MVSEEINSTLKYIRLRLLVHTQLNWVILSLLSSAEQEFLGWIALMCILRVVQWINNNMNVTRQA